MGVSVPHSRRNRNHSRRSRLSRLSRNRSHYHIPRRWKTRGC